MELRQEKRTREFIAVLYKLVKGVAYILTSLLLLWNTAQASDAIEPGLRSTEAWDQSLWFAAFLLIIFVLLGMVFNYLKIRQVRRLQQDILQRSQTRIDELSMLAELSQDLCSSVSQQALCAHIFKRLQQATPINKIEIGLLDEESQCLHFIFNAMANRRLSEYGILLDYESHPVTEVVANKREFCVQQQQDWLHVFPGETRYREGLELSTAIFPMLVDNKVIGCLSAQAQHENAFSAEHLGLIRAVSQQAAVALANSRSRQALSETQHRLDVAISTTSAGLWELDPESGELTTNDYWSTMLGYTRTELDEQYGNRRQRFEKLLHPEDFLLFEKALEAHLLGRIPFMRMDLRMRAKSGQWIWVLSMAKIEACSVNNAVPKVVGINLNINDAKQLQNQLMMADRQAEAAALAKSEFQARMSNELRTPLHTIIGMSQLVMGTELNETQQNYLLKVNHTAQSLLARLNDFLGISKVEVGKLQMEKVDFALNEVMAQVADVVAEKAREKDLELIFDVPMDLPVQLRGDPWRLTQVLINLCSNGIKFTSSGFIEISVAVESEDSAVTTLHFCVKDTGGGMDSEQTQRLQNALSKTGSSVTADLADSGLGLSICRRLTEMMGGKIWCNSEAGKGSEFHFTAQLGRADPLTLADSLDYVAELTGVTALIADDSSRLRQSIVNKLREVNMKPFVATSTEEVCMTLNDGSFYTDLVLVDIDMPGVSLEMIKQWAARMPLVLMSAKGVKKSIKGCINLAKPMTNQALLNAVARAMGIVRKNEFNTAAKSQQFVANTDKLKGARVLLVEDIDVNRELVSELLRANGVQVIVAEHGRQALEILAENQVDGVLMDCQMPVMDGFAATRELRRQARFESLPVIAMTSNTMPADRIMASGMNGRILKPINVEEMFAEMAKWITPSMRFVIPDKNEEEPVSLVPEDINIYGLDAREGLEIVQGNGELYLRLLVKFCASFKDFSSQFEMLSDQSDKQRTRRLVHSLKGAAGNIGARLVYQLASELEATYLAEPPDCDNEKQQQLYMQLRAQLAQMITELENLSAQSESEAAVSRLTDEQLKQQLRTLQGLLMEFDSRAVDMIADIQNGARDSRFASKIALIAQQLNEFAFELALENTQALLAELESEG